MANNLPTQASYPKIADTRLQQLHYAMEDQKAEALVITYLPNIRYLTNFSGSEAHLFVIGENLHFLTDDRYEEQIKTELYPLPNLYTHITRDVWKLISDKKLLKDVTSLAFEADRISYSDAVLIRNVIRPIKFKPAPQIVEPYTMNKSPEELENIQKACDITVQVYEKILELIKPGVSELDIDLEITYQSRKLGSECEAFPSIVVSGPRGAIVHGRASDRKLKLGDIIIMDFGCKVNGFCSDMTRTVALGKATKDQKSIYKMLVKAKDSAIAEVRPGMNGKLLDKVARDIIEKEGFGKYFQHSLGHGIGIEPHEMPTITFRKEDQIVPENSVIAIEPGVYIPDKFGMRVEDLCFVTRNGGRHLMKAPEDLPVI